MEPKKQTPSIGRVVHFVYGDKHVPALIIDPAWASSEGQADSQALAVFTASDPPFTMIAQYDPDCAGGTWHWPEYVA